MNIYQKKKICFLLLITALLFLSSPCSAQPIEDSITTGLVEITGFKYPVYLFVPLDYQLAKKYPLVIMAPSEDQSSEESMEYLMGLAKRKSFFILVTNALWPREGVVPYNLDKWLLKIKNEILERYSVNKNMIFLVGKDKGAHYASYLATKYQEDFSAAALLGGAWYGGFEKIIIPKSSPYEQIPFFIGFEADQTEILDKNQVLFEKFQQKGYLIKLVQLKPGESFSSLDFRKELFKWLEENSKNWQISLKEGEKTFKERFRKAIKDFFTV